MDQTKNQNSNTDTAETNDYVPVGESIKYHKRAKNAEKKLKEINEQLETAQTENQKLTRQLDNLRLEQKLSVELLKAGAVDTDTAVLLIKQRLDDNEDLEPGDVIDQLRKEKAFLFADETEIAPAMESTRTARQRFSHKDGLEQAAKKAARSGSARDLQQYLKLRRNCI